MGNELTLQMIAAASAKLKRIDPDYVSNVTKRRTKARRDTNRDRLHKLHREYSKDMKRYVVRSNSEKDPNFEESVGDLEMHDTILLDLAGTDSGKPDKIIENPTAAILYTHDGKTQTLSQWEMLTGVSGARISARLHRGYTFEEALTISDRDIKRKHCESVFNVAISPRRVAKLYTHDDQTMTLSAWSKTTGICIGTLTSRLHAGWSVLDAFTVRLDSKRQRRGMRTHITPQAPKRRYECNGESKTLDEWSISTGVKVGTLQTRLQVGWSLERTLTTPLIAKTDHRMNMKDSKAGGGWVKTNINLLGTGLLGSLDTVPK